MTLPSLSSGAVDGRTLAWREAGRGRVVIFLHDICADSAAWAAQFADLARDHRVVAWDCPGFGGSALLAVQEPSVDDYADALAALYGILGIERAVLVGAGMGAAIAAAFAQRHPRMVGAMGLVGAQAKIGGPEASQMLSWLQDLVRDSGAFGELYAVRALPQRAPGGVRAAVAAMAARLSPIGFGRACQMLARTDLAARIKGTTAPLLLVYGDLDTIAPPEAGTVLDTIVRGTVTEIVEGAGHAPQMESPQPFNGALRAFLRAARSKP